MVRATFQLPEVNVSVASLIVASPGSPLERSRTTSLSGWASRTIWNVSLDPASVTSVEPSDSVVVIPAASSSSVVTLTVWSGSPSKASSEIGASTLIVTSVI